MLSLTLYIKHYNTVRNYKTQLVLLLLLLLFLLLLLE